MQSAERDAPILEGLRQLVELREGSYTGCEVKLAMLPLRSVGWGLYVGRMTFSDTRDGEDRTVDYEGFRLLEAFIPIQEALQTIENAALSGHLHFGGFDIEIQGHLEDNRSSWGYQRPGYWASDGSAFGLRWPTNMIQLSQRPDPQLVHPRGPLVTQDLPLYPDISTLLGHQIGHEVQGTIFTHSLVILLPNYHGRIKDVQVGMRSIAVQTETHPSRSDGLLVKVFAKAGETIQDEQRLSAGPQNYEISLPSRPNTWEVALLGDDGEYLDGRSPYLASVRGGAHALLDADAIRQLTMVGENEAIEFKLLPRDKAYDELVETEVAFSNTAGGIILVGVGDNGQTVGAGGTTRDSLLSVIRDKTEPPIASRITRVDVDEKPVYVVEVSEGGDKPYLLTGKGVAYVRAGSTDRPATRYELREMLTHPNSGTWPGHL